MMNSQLLDSGARPPRAVAVSETACQTTQAYAVEEGVESRMARDQWQKQMSAMSDWLQTGVAILRDGVAEGSPTLGREGAAVRARQRWSDECESDEPPR